MLPSVVVRSKLIVENLAINCIFRPLSNNILFQSLHMLVKIQLFIYR